jgi:tryptophan halogenase
MAQFGEPLREVVVVGGGITGWAAAAALKRRVPALSVTILPLAPPPAALADRLASTLPSILGFHADMGLGIEDSVLRTGSAYRLGTLFSGWAQGLPDYVHAYGGHGAPIGGVSFHLLWARAAIEGSAPPFETLGSAAMLARAGCFIPPSGEPGAPFSDHEFGLTLDLERYAAMLRAFAQHIGVRVRQGALKDVTLRSADGFIEALHLDDGSLLHAELFLDCSGPRALLHSALDIARDDWSRWLPCDRLLFAEGPPPMAPSPLDTVTATATGWRWSTATPAAALHGIAYASTYSSDAAAAEALHAATGALPSSAAVTIAPGARPRPWLRNCVAIGDAAVTLEPLEWTNLHLAHSAIDRLITMLPGRLWSPVEAADYNRQALAEAGRVRDFAALHYAVARRDDPFWHARAAVEPPASLAHSLALFRERGRLPFHEEETFARDSWLAVLFGQGVLPRRADPLTRAVPREEVLQAMEARRTAIERTLPSLPTHAAYLGAQMRQLDR